MCVYLYVQFMDKNCLLGETVTEILKYYNVKTPMRQERRKSLGTEQNPEDSSKILFSEVLRLRIDHTDDSGKIILILIWEDH